MSRNVHKRNGKSARSPLQYSVFFCGKGKCPLSMNLENALKLPRNVSFRENIVNVKRFRQMINFNS